MKKQILLAIASMVTSAGAAESTKPKAELFGRTPEGVAVEVFTLTNSKGIKLRAMTYGAIVLSLETPDRNGRLGDIVLGYNTFSEYLKDTEYFGAVIGRYCNRIANGKFMLDGKKYSLALNNAPAGDKCSLHGGLKGFDKVLWKGEGLTREKAQGVKFSYTSKDGEEGYPGTIDINVTYWLTEKNEWQIEYRAVTDKATPVNITQHSYFNLKGEGNGNILGHQLSLAASKFTPVTRGLIPTGEVRSVKGTPFDFTKLTAIGLRINVDDEQIKFGRGYDHNWVLDNQDGKLVLAAVVHEPTTGRYMKVLTTEPGIQVYCGNFLNGKLTGKAGKKYEFRHGFCLETQHFPDSPNRPEFPSTILRPGKVMESCTIFRFSAK